jgi:predicted methyltransferase
MKIPLMMAAVCCLAACGKAPSESYGERGESAAAPARAEQAQASTPVTDEQLRMVLAGEHRSEQNRARDVYRNPLMTLQFFGLYPEARVVEINPGGGWYTEILAPLLKDRGQLIAAVIDPDVPDMPGYVVGLAKGIQQKFNQDEANYGAAHIHFYNPNEPVLGEPESADMVLTFRNVHSWLNADQAEGMFAAFYQVLKPGGTLGVVQHRAAEGANYKETSRQGYVTQEAVIMLAEDAGFRLVDTSDINANPLDTRDHPKGVWTLPPSLRLGEEDRDKYLAIGESDRMTLRFVRD